MYLPHNKKNTQQPADDHRSDNLGTSPRKLVATKL
jgi:hypothetical protein